MQYDYSMSLVKSEKDLKQGLTIVKSVSPVKAGKKEIGCEEEVGYEEKKVTSPLVFFLRYL